MHDSALMGLHGHCYSVSQAESVHGSNSDAKGGGNTPLPVRMMSLLTCANAIANDHLFAEIESVLGIGVVIFGASTTDPIKGAVSVQPLNDRLAQLSAVAMGIWNPSQEAQVHISQGRQPQENRCGGPVTGRIRSSNWMGLPPGLCTGADLASSPVPEWWTPSRSEPSPPACPAPWRAITGTVTSCGR